jgi:lipoprotein-anchoring transpeptidase ErfK/SrfK
VVAAGAETHTRTGRQERSARAAEPKFDANGINTPTIESLQQGDQGSAVVRAQILLDRAHFSCGEVDGNFGSNLAKTVTAFQQERKLPVTGSVGEATWSVLNEDSAPPLFAYTITAEDEKGPFVQVPKDMTAQAKLSFLGYSSPLEELAERFHTTQALLQALNPGTDFGQSGHRLTVPNVLTLPPAEAAKVVVSKSESSVRAYNASEKLLAFYVATIGSEHDPLPIGSWKIRSVIHNPFFHYNARLFWDADDRNAKATIHSGPRNPVGLVWIDLSKEHYGIHGTPYPSLIGHTTSHGCIRLTNWDAAELAEMVRRGIEADLKE